MELEKDIKFWIYNNLKAFYKSDPYFKSFPIDVILGNLKGALQYSSNLEELIQKLETRDFNRHFKFFRKIEEGTENILYFKYTELSFQIESLMACWKEIKKLEKNIRLSYGINDYSDEGMNLFSNSTEEFSDDQESNFLFGLRPNLINLYGIKDEDVSIYSYEMSKIGTIRSDFKAEYNSFKQSIRQKTTTIAQESGKGVFFQTDIKKFYHSISPTVAKKFLQEHYPKSKNLIIYLEILEQSGEKELPIGWILSSTIAYLILMKFHEIIRLTLANELEQLSFSKINIKEFEIVSYVDDFVFILKTKELLNSNEKKELEKAIITCSEEVFHYLLKDRVIKFHSSSSGHKNKTFDITPAFADIIDSNFFDFIANTSIRNNEDLDIFDELMLPGDNNLIINEKVQFLKSLSTTKRKLEEIVKGPLSDFDNVFKKIKYKLDTDGIKYIQSIVSFMGAYFDELRNQNKFDEAILINRMEEVEDRVLSNSNQSIDNIVKYITSLKRIITPNNTKELGFLANSLKECKKHVRKNQYYTKSDIALLEMLSELIRSELLEERTSSHEFKVRITEAELPFFSTFQKYVNIISVLNGNNNAKIVLDIEDVYIIIEAMKKVYFSATYKQKEDFLIHATERIIAFTNNKKALFSSIVEEGSYLFISSLTLPGRRRFLKWIKSNNGSSLPVFNEIVYQLSNFDSISEEVKTLSLYKIQKFRSNLADISNSNNLKKHEFNSIFIKKNLSTEKSIIESVIFLSYSLSSQSIDDFWRILFFRYTKIDSSHNLSWKGLFATFSPSSLEIGTMLKSFLIIKKFKKSAVLKYALQSIANENKEIKEEEVNDSDISTIINLDSYGTQFSLNHMFEKSLIRITIVSLPLHPDPLLENCDYDFEEGFSFKKKSVKMLHNKILRAIRHAKNECSDIIIFPELSIPRKFLETYLKEAGDNKMIFIGGLEYVVNGSREAMNEIVISLPTHRKRCLTGKSFWPLSQIKIYPSTEEYQSLKKNDFKFVSGSELIIFKSSYWKNFSILNCADFFSMRLKNELKGKIQTLFVPALNYDSTTFNHLAQASVRELFSYCVICNSQITGSSSALGPFRKNEERTIFSIEGQSSPDYSTVTINPAVVDLAQSFHPTVLFKKTSGLERFKQLPPDWEKK